MSLKNFSETEKYREWITNYHHDHQHPINRKIHEVGVPVILASLPIFLFNKKLGAAMFIGGWAVQFLGHAIEGKAPTVTKDPLGAIFSGPVYFLDKWMVAAGLKDKTVVEELGLEEPAASESAS